jgi:hypothetical protein
MSKRKFMLVARVRSCGAYMFEHWMEAFWVKLAALVQCSNILCSLDPIDDDWKAIDKRVYF